MTAITSSSSRIFRSCRKSTKAQTIAWASIPLMSASFSTLFINTSLAVLGKTMLTGRGSSVEALSLVAFK